MTISKEIIKEIAKIIAEDYQPEKILLFGSYAKGKSDSGSDLDLLIISDKEKEKPRRKRGLSLLYKLRKYHISKDLLFYTNDEIERWKDIDGAFIAEVLKEAEVLYGN